MNELPSNAPKGSTPVGTPANLAAASTGVPNLPTGTESGTSAPGANSPNLTTEPTAKGPERTDTPAPDTEGHVAMTSAVGSNDVPARHNSEYLPHVGDAQNPEAEGHGVLPERAHPNLIVPQDRKIDARAAAKMNSLRELLRAEFVSLNDYEGALAGDLKTELIRFHQWLNRRLSLHTANGGATDL